MKGMMAPKALLYAEPTMLEVAVDLSYVAVETAWTKSFERSRKEPNLLLVSRRDYAQAEMIISHLPLTMRCIMVLIAEWFEDDYWLIGNINAPGDFVGSEGA